MSAGSERSLVREVRTVVLTVLRMPTRFIRLCRLGPRGLASMARFLTSVVPRASTALATIRRVALAIPDDGLREQALASIDQKAYHVLGGAILATFLPNDAAARYVRIVAPLETIYDYLDNLCDRLPGVDERAYPSLHDALLDAVDNRRPLADYYRDGPFADDGGYLRRLVLDVRAELVRLPNYEAVREPLRAIAQLYTELQTHKHGSAERREAVCSAWYAGYRDRFPGLYWWEFAAACGSSLPVFALVYLASRTDLADGAIEATLAAYFPNVSALHILLDYFIDQAEDREHRELNFVACYATNGEAVERVSRLVATTSARLQTLANGEFHQFVLQAMCLFYLTHPKVFEQHLDRDSARMLAALG